jgi:hypothetical protein
MTTTESGTTTELRCVAALGDGAFTRAQAETIRAAFSNVFIEDDQGTHFRLVVRETAGGLVWRAFNFEAEAGYWLRSYITRYGVLKPLQPHLDALTALNEQQLTMTQRHEFLWFGLRDLAQAVAATVLAGDKPALPADSLAVWTKASHIALSHFGQQGESAWGTASQWLTHELEQKGGPAADGARA